MASPLAGTSYVCTIPTLGDFILTSQPEFAHPYHVLKDKTELVIASPKGGEAPLDPSSVEMFKNDPVSADFLQNGQELWKNTVKLADVLPRVSEFDALFYVGGHGRKFPFVFSVALE